MASSADSEAVDSDTLPTSVLEAKRIEYEEFLENNLKTAVKTLEEELHDAESLQTDCANLRQSVTHLIGAELTELDTMVDVGMGVYARAHVPDTSRIYVDIGLHCLLEVSIHDVPEIMLEREAHCARLIELRRQKLVEAEADVSEAQHLIGLLGDVARGEVPWLEGLDVSVARSFGDDGEAVARLLQESVAKQKGRTPRERRQVMAVKAAAAAAAARKAARVVPLPGP